MASEESNLRCASVLDRGRLFYLRLAEELSRLGLHRVHADGAIFVTAQPHLNHNPTPTQQKVG